MNIRILESTDAQQYWDLRLEALQQNPEAFATSYEEAVKRDNPVEGVARNLSTAGNYTFGAFEDEALVGVVTLLQEASMKLRHRANIFAMYVSPTMRGKGVGEALLQAAINHAKTIDRIDKINLTVVTTNESAKKLYTKLGFKLFGTETKALIVNGTYYDEDYMELFIGE